MFDFLESQHIEEAIVVEILYFDIYKKVFYEISMIGVISDKLTSICFFSYQLYQYSIELF